MGWPCPSPEEVRLILANAKPELLETGKRADNGSEKGRRVYKGINANDYADLYRGICLTGMRRDEARFLTWEDVDLTNKVIVIRSGYKNGKHWRPKTDSSRRRLPIVCGIDLGGVVTSCCQLSVWRVRARRVRPLHRCVVTPTHPGQLRSEKNLPVSCQFACTHLHAKGLTAIFLHPTGLDRMT